MTRAENLLIEKLGFRPVMLEMVPSGVAAKGSIGCKDCMASCRIFANAIKNEVKVRCPNCGEKTL